MEKNVLDKLYTEQVEQARKLIATGIRDDLKEVLLQQYPELKEDNAVEKPKINKKPIVTERVSFAIPDLVKVIKEHISAGPFYKNSKKDFLEMCEKLNITSISQFYDILFDSLRCGCSKNFWQHLYGPCLDSEGDHIAYGKEVISKAMDKPEKDLTCHDICEVCGSCAYMNQICYGLFYYLANMMDDKNLTLENIK